MVEGMLLLAKDWPVKGLYNWVPVVQTPEALKVVHKPPKLPWRIAAVGKVKFTFE
jgi:hypothetical protein